MFGRMDIRIVIAVYVTFVTVDAKQNIQGNEIFVSRQNDICDYYPQIKCSTDCSSLTVCHNPSSPPISLKCPRNQPYCANGKCGTVNGNCQLNLEDNADTDSFVCTSDGIFPDPTNCTNMYTCEGLTATKTSCSAGTIFNSKDNTCVRGTPRIDHASRRICSKITCENKPHGYILFPANPEFYAYCSNGSMLLYKCDVGDNAVFDIAANKCVFNCKSAGLFRDPLNCTSYYSCQGLIKFRSTKLYCADGQYFDGMQCVTGVDCGDGSITDEPSTSSPVTSITFPVESTMDGSTSSTTDGSPISSPVTSISFPVESTTDGSTVSSSTEGSTDSTSTDGSTDSTSTDGSTDSTSTDGSTVSSSTEGSTDSTSTDGSTDSTSTDGSPISSPVTSITIPGESVTDSSTDGSTDVSTDSSSTDGLTDSTSTDGSTDSTSTDGSTDSTSTDGSTDSTSTDGSTGSTSTSITETIPFRKLVPAMVANDSMTLSFNSVWKHKGKYSYRIAKDL